MSCTLYIHTTCKIGAEGDWWTGQVGHAGGFRGSRNLESREVAGCKSCLVMLSLFSSSCSRSFSLMSHGGFFPHRLPTCGSDQRDLFSCAGCDRRVRLLLANVLFPSKRNTARREDRIAPGADLHQRQGFVKVLACRAAGGVSEFDCY